MSVVLVVEPETAQANLLKKMQKRLGAQVVVVKTTGDAIDAIDRAIPDVILLSALLSPRDEDRLMTHLRSLEGASHLQTLTIPQLRTEKASDTSSAKKGFFGKKRATSAPGKCDPAVFAEEISAQLLRAADLRSRPSSGAFPILISINAPAPAPEPAAIIHEPATFADAWSSERFVAAPVNAEPQIEPVVEPTPSVFDTPILSTADEPVTVADLWASERFAAAPVNVESVFEPVEPPSVFDTSIFDTPIVSTADEPVTVADPWVSERFLSAPVNPEPVVNTADSADDELDRLTRELGLSLDSDWLMCRTRNRRNGWPPKSHSSRLRPKPSWRRSLNEFALRLRRAASPSSRGYRPTPMRHAKRRSQMRERQRRRRHDVRWPRKSRASGPRRKAPLPKR